MSSEQTPQLESQNSPTSDGINPDRLQNISQEELSSFVCKLCSMLLRNPLICKTCQSRFCEDCLNKWAKSNLNCPNQCEDFQRSTILQPLVESISKLKLSCENKKHGCQEIVLMEEIQSHQQSCQFMIQQCKGCNNSFQKSKLEDHMQSCENLMIECQQCKFYILQKDKKDHSSERCFNNKIEGVKNFFKQEIQKTTSYFQKEIDQLKNKNAQLQKQILHNKQNQNFKNNKMQDLKILNNISLKSKSIYKSQRTQNIMAPIQQLVPKKLVNLQLGSRGIQSQFQGNQKAMMQSQGYNRLNHMQYNKMNQMNGMNNQFIYGQKLNQQYDYGNQNKLQNYLQKPLQQNINTHKQNNIISVLQQQPKFK